jgi:AcrR family transcriptional regulator
MPVSLTEPAADTRLASAPRTTAQLRVINAALGLFAEHGVNGTSLQMIADAIGVTKAAIYHQFKTKDEIVFAAIEVELAKLETALDAADREESPARAREIVLTQVIDSAVERRRMVGVVQHDPVVVGFLAQHEPFRRLMTRLYAVLTGGDTGVDARVRAAMVSAAIGGAVMHPLVLDLDDSALRSRLRTLALELLDLRD